VVAGLLRRASSLALLRWPVSAVRLLSAGCEEGPWGPGVEGWKEGSWGPGAGLLAGSSASQDRRAFSRLSPSHTDSRDRAEQQLRRWGLEKEDGWLAPGDLDLLLARAPYTDQAFFGKYLLLTLGPGADQLSVRPQGERGPEDLEGSGKGSFSISEAVRGLASRRPSEQGSVGMAELANYDSHMV